MAVIASFTGQAVSITEVVSVDSADGLVSSKVSTADGGVWWTSNDPEVYQGHEAPPGSAFLIGTHPHPKWRLHYHIVSANEDHIRQIRLWRQARRARRLLSEAYCILSESSHPDDVKDLSESIEAWVSRQADRDSRREAERLQVPLLLQSLDGTSQTR